MSSEKNFENPSDTETLRPKIEMPEQLNCKLIIQKGNTEVSITRRQFLDTTQSRKTRSIRTRDFSRLKSKELKTIRSFNPEETKEKNGENTLVDDKGEKVFLLKKMLQSFFEIYNTVVIFNEVGKGFLCICKLIFFMISLVMLKNLLL